METLRLEIPRAEARHLYREYKKHRHYSEPMDDEIRRAYQLLAQGRLIIRAVESVAKAGVGDDGWPRLALAPADAKECRCRIRGDGGAVMTSQERIWWRRSNASAKKWFDWPAGTFPQSSKRNGLSDGISFVPPVPLHLRPKRGLTNYHILWEAEWRPMPPVDPYLLRRIGKGDMWLVVAMWDLTEVERAALAARITTA